MTVMRGRYRTRTDDLLVVSQLLYQLCYTPVPDRLEASRRVPAPEGTGPW